MRTPIKGESSAVGRRLPSDAPTYVDTPAPAARKPPPSDAPTYVDPGPVSRRTPASDAPTFVGIPGSEGQGNDSMGPGGGRPPSSGRSLGDAAFGQPVLEEGYLLAQRYEISSMLGEGGMGAVYKARDVELNRVIAVKTIRREFGGNQAIIERFKQELILSTQVTHKNVVRIYDLGESEGMKFITMEYIEGHDLRSLIVQEQRLPVEEVVDIIQQSCRALDAAHSVGVIHRDLKPQNIMREKSSGRVVVMDFGLARTLEGDGMTQSGALVGTMEYMSPEQALSKNLDQRSDIFSLGLIFFELLTGQVPYRADSALASLIKRTQERAIPVSQCDASISGPLDRIVNRCLELDVEQRYQSAAELLADLDLWSGKGATGVTTFQADRYVAPRKLPSKQMLWAGGGIAAVLALSIAGYVGLHSRSAKTGVAVTGVAAVPAMSLAILPFQNSTGNPEDNWMGASLSDMLSTDIGQSAHLRTISTDRLHQVLADLHIGPETAADPDTVRRVAEFSNADIVVSGKYSRFGDQIVIDAMIRDLKHDQTVPIKAQALAKDLPAAIDSLADSVRKNLSLSPDVLKELKAQSFKASSSSEGALRDYNDGLALMRAGKNLEALKNFQAASSEDSQFALAFSRLAEVQAELGSQSEAEQSSQRALELASSENLPLPEKYLISASHARIVKDTKKALEAYLNLATSWPNDVDVQSNLGTLYSETGDYAKAKDVFAKILKADPKNIKALWNMGVVENNVGNPQGALDSLSKGLSLATQVDNQEQKALILLSTGISYRLLNKQDEAMRNYQESIAISQKIGNKRAVAAALDEVADLQTRSGKSDAALVTFNQALALLRELGQKQEIADTLVDMGTVYQDRGEYDQALKTYKEALQIEREAGDQSAEALCLNNIASVHMSQGDTENALTNYQQALQLREKLGVPGDIAETLEGLSETYTYTGQYDSAMTLLMRALDLARKADDTRVVALVSHQMGMVFEAQGRLGAAVKSMQDAEKSLRQRGELGRDMAALLNDLARVLAKCGRGDEAAKPLAEAETIARGFKNDALNATILTTKADVLVYKGDLKGAEPLYKSALALAARTKDKDIQVRSKLNMARIPAAQGQWKDALAILKPLQEMAGSVEAYLSTQCAVTLAAAEVGAEQYGPAEHDLEQDLTKSEKAGMHLESAKIYYLRGVAARLGGNADRGRVSYYYSEAIRLLEAARADPGAEKLLDRVDLKAMYDDARKWK